MDIYYILLQSGGKYIVLVSPEKLLKYPEKNKIVLMYYILSQLGGNLILLASPETDVMFVSDKLMYSQHSGMTKWVLAN